MEPRPSAVRELAPTASARALQAALKAVHLAHDAQFRTVAELAALRFAFLRRQAVRDGFLLAVCPLEPDATEADVDEEWRSAEAQVAAAKRARSRPPLNQRRD